MTVHEYLCKFKRKLLPIFVYSGTLRADYEQVCSQRLSADGTLRAYYEHF